MSLIIDLFLIGTHLTNYLLLSRKENIRFVSKKCYDQSGNNIGGFGRTFPQPKSFHHGVVCCGSHTCETELYDNQFKNRICQEKKTYDEAVDMCESHDLRLCSNQELTYEKLCCNSQCNNHAENWVWINDTGNIL